MDALLYTRVSHDDQVKFGLSLEAQQEALLKYCKEQNINVRGIYSDEGISAKTIKKRKQFMKMLDEARQGEVILFTRLDRFSRTLLDAVTVVKDLEKRKISIKAIYEEDIDTSTADGRFLFYLKVSLAERERDKTSERIKHVFNYKISIGEAVSGEAPLGYNVVNKRFVINEDDAQKIRDLFDVFEKYNSVSKCVDWWNKTHFYRKESYYTIKYKRLSNPFYAGRHPRGLNDHFCEPIIDPERFDEIQKKLKRNVRKPSNGKTYLFSSIIKCDCCGRNMIGNEYKKNYIRYRCNRATMDKVCSNTKMPSEKKIEKVLLKDLEEKTKGITISATITDNKTKDNLDTQIKSVELKIKRSKELYVEGIYTKEEFDVKYKDLSLQLKELIDEKNNKPKSKKVEELKDVDFITLYDKLNKENKAAFWHKFVSEIRFDGEEFKVGYL